MNKKLTILPILFFSLQRDQLFSQSQKVASEKGDSMVACYDKPRGSTLYTLHSNDPMNINDRGLDYKIDFAAGEKCAVRSGFEVVRRPDPHSEKRLFTALQWLGTKSYSAMTLNSEAVFTRFYSEKRKATKVSTWSEEGHIHDETCGNCHYMQNKVIQHGMFLGNNLSLGRVFYKNSRSNPLGSMKDGPNLPQLNNENRRHLLVADEISIGYHRRVSSNVKVTSTHTGKTYDEINVSNIYIRGIFAPVLPVFDRNGQTLTTDLLPAFKSAWGAAVGFHWEIENGIAHYNIEFGRSPLLGYFFRWNFPLMQLTVKRSDTH